MDHRFLWNEVLLRPFLAVSEEAAVYPFLMPVIHGAVFIHRCVMKVIIYSEHIRDSAL